jgi:hypothetical protein
MSSQSREPTENEEITEIEEVVKFMSELAESIPYLDDDYKILVVGGCPSPFIVMSPECFMDLERRILGID